MFVVLRELKAKQNFKTLSISPRHEVRFHFFATNGLALGEEADFEALNCLPALNLTRSTKLHLSTEPAFLPNAC